MGHGLRCIEMRCPGRRIRGGEGVQAERRPLGDTALPARVPAPSTRAHRRIPVTDIDTSRRRERVSPTSSSASRSHAAAPPRSFLPPLLHRCLRRRRPRQARPARRQTQRRHQARRQLVQASHEPEEDLVCGRAVHCLRQEEEMRPLQVCALVFGPPLIPKSVAGSLTRTGMRSQRRGLRCPLRSVTTTSSPLSTLTRL